MSVELFYFEGKRHVGGYIVRSGILVPALAGINQRLVMEPCSSPADLFRAFAEIPANEKGIREFANKYGFLGVDEEQVRGLTKPKAHYPESGITHQTATIFRGEPISIWLREVAAMQWAIERWSAAKQTSDSEDAEPAVFGLIDLQNLVNHRLSGLTPLQLVLDGEQLVLRIAARNLLGFLWAQLAQAIDASLIVRRCAACSKWMVLHSSKGPTARRNTCSDACRQRLYAERKAKQAHPVRKTGLAKKPQRRE